MGTSIKKMILSNQVVSVDTKKVAIDIVEKELLKK